MNAATELITAVSALEKAAERADALHRIIGRTVDALADRLEADTAQQQLLAGEHPAVTRLSRQVAHRAALAHALAEAEAVAEADE